MHSFEKILTDEGTHIHSSTEVRHAGQCSLFENVTKKKKKNHSFDSSEEKKLANLQQNC